MLDGAAAPKADVMRQPQVGGGGPAANARETGAEMSTAKELRRAIGKKIAKIEYSRTWDDSMKTYLHKPVIVLDDGTRLRFTTEEGDGDYGVSIGITKTVTKARAALNTQKAEEK